LQADGPINPNEAQAMHHKDVRANGLLLADMHGLKLADRTLSTGSSNLLPLTLLSKAEQYIDNPDSFDALEDPMELFGKRNHTVVSKEQLSMLLAHVEQLIQMLGDSIHKGNISIQPCRLKQMNGCKYCNYQAICRIQTVDFFKNSEELIPLTHETIWSRLESQTNRKGANSNASMDN
jgi:ATP-dependent helicase/nuclease subunit B